MFSLRLPEAMEKRLEQLATNYERSKSHFVKEAIALYLTDIEDLEEAKRRTANPQASYLTTDELLSALDNNDEL